MKKNVFRQAYIKGEHETIINSKVEKVEEEKPKKKRSKIDD